MRNLPELDTVVDAADAGLHPWVHRHVGVDARRATLAEELTFWLRTAAQDMEYAEAYARNAPVPGLGPSDYLDRWVALPNGGHVLLGPRYLGLDPNRPFVAVSASDRPLVHADAKGLASVALAQFAAFSPGFVSLWTKDSIGSWPGATHAQRQLVGLIGAPSTQPHAP